MDTYSVIVTAIAAIALPVAWFLLWRLQTERKISRAWARSVNTLVQNEIALHRALAEQNVPLGLDLAGKIRNVVRLIDDLAGRIVYLQEQLDTGGQKRDQGYSDSSMDARLRVPGQQWPSSDG